MNRERLETFIFAAIGALLGFVLIIAPVMHRVHRVTLFAVAEAAINHLSFFALWLLFGAGMVWGLLLTRRNSFVASFLQPALLPLIAIVQMFHDPTSHNLWPLEFMIYGFMGMVGVAGAGLGLFIKRRVTKLPAR